MKSRTSHRSPRVAGTVTGLAVALSLAYGAASFADGQLTGQWAFGASGWSSTQAITGGTGKYEGARGQFVLADGKNGLESVVVELLG
jgi:hypothetical protein